MHESLRSSASSVPLGEVTTFINTIHTLLSDVASHVTQVRMYNICWETGLVAPAIKPQLLTPTPTQLFEDPKTVLDHTKLSKAVRSATKKPSSNKRFNNNNNNRQPNSSNEVRQFSVEQQTQPQQRSRSNSGASQTNKHGNSGKNFHHRSPTQNKQ